MWLYDKNSIMSLHLNCSNVLRSKILLTIIDKCWSIEHVSLLKVSFRMSIALKFYCVTGVRIICLTVRTFCITLEDKNNVKCCKDKQRWTCNALTNMSFDKQNPYTASLDLPSDEFARHMDLGSTLDRLFPVFMSSISCDTWSPAHLYGIYWADSFFRGLWRDIVLCIYHAKTWVV